VGIKEEADLRQTYTGRYRRSLVEAGTVAERDALGSDYGASGYTTLAQADGLVERLALGPGSRLLDIGSGCGYPGLRLAARSGCEVVVTDLTLPGMQQANRRAEADGMSLRAAAVVASARRLPFRPDSFDAIVHADVLC
jgi:cyclopropane fatty-acyl-phospholipid synthase-like methyltransferase